MKKLVILTIFVFAILSIFSFALIGNENESTNNDVNTINLEPTSTQIEETETKKIIRSSGRSSSSSSSNSETTSTTSDVSVESNSEPARVESNPEPFVVGEREREACKHLEEQVGSWLYCVKNLDKIIQAEATRIPISTSKTSTNGNGLCDDSHYRYTTYGEASCKDSEKEQNEKSTGIKISASTPSESNAYDKCYAANGGSYNHAAAQATCRHLLKVQENDESEPTRIKISYAVPSDSTAKEACKHLELDPVFYNHCVENHNEDAEEENFFAKILGFFGI